MWEAIEHLTQNVQQDRMAWEDLPTALSISVGNDAVIEMAAKEGLVDPTDVILDAYYTIGDAVDG